MVVFTSLWPKSSWTVRMSYPPSNRWVANECLNVWHVARFVNPALRALAVMTTGRRAALRARITSPRSPIQDLPIQEQQRRKRLALSRGTDLFLDRQMRQEGIDFGLGHFSRVMDSVEVDKPLDPLAVDLRQAFQSLLLLRLFSQHPSPPCPNRSTSRFWLPAQISW